MRKFLVSARTDRGGVAVSRDRINAVMDELGFDRYFETSAKQRRNVRELAEAVREAIDWDALQKVSSTELFQSIKTFLTREKESGRVLSTADDLYRSFLSSKHAPVESHDLRVQFDTCIRRVEARGLIQRLSFGDLVLLQPELLDAYASALVNAALDEPDGLGCIAEEDARGGRFAIPKDERIANRGQEKLLLIATVEDMLRHEVALREQAQEGPYLVFPSQFTRDYPDAPDPVGKAVMFEFEGPIANVHATLCVRLARSGLLEVDRNRMYQNAAVYTARMGGACGLYLRHIDDGRAELALFFDQAASEQTRFEFEEYVHAHLRRRALPETIERRRIFVCSDPECGEAISDGQARRRRERGHTAIQCPVCEAEVSLLDREERLVVAHVSVVPEMDRAADDGRDREAAASVIEGKLASKDYDVFLCHNSADKPAVKKIGEQLKQRGILPWLDEWELRPGQPWQEALEEQIETIKCAAVFVGEKGIGPWEKRELRAFLRQFVKRECPVIPLLLDDAPDQPDLPVFFEDMTWVDFRELEPDPMEQLIWGITGERSARPEGRGRRKG
jgi:nucleotide-binding universal stress UspA family protein